MLIPKSSQSRVVIPGRTGGDVLFSKCPCVQSYALITDAPEFFRRRILSALVFVLVALVFVLVFFMVPRQNGKDISEPAASKNGGRELGQFIRKNKSNTEKTFYHRVFAVLQPVKENR